ncbi:MAG: XrtA system polysaccharide deacetylase [Pirellulaceae bacterium]
MIPETLNAFSVDVEDYFQVSAFEKHVSRANWTSIPSRVIGNTQRLLELLDGHQIKATFFVLGWIARTYPELVREIDAAGHELASHSYWHQLVYELTPEQFRTDLIDSRKAIEDAAGRRVVIYRAPSFSITHRSLWALEILAEEGFQIDSSIYPIHHDRYGMPNAETRIHEVQTPSGSIWEFPPAVLRFGGLNVPISGGGYFRLYPLLLTVQGLRRINRRHHHPFVFYVHPWEIDPHQPRIAGPSRKSRLRHYVHLATTEKKLNHLLGQFRFGTLGEVIESVAPHVHPQTELGQTSVKLLVPTSSRRN